MLREIRLAGVIPAISLNPRTPLDMIEPYLLMVDRVLLMSVEPGYGGQTFLPGSIERVRDLRERIGRVNPGIDIQLDGGVTLENAEAAAQAGADILIAGSAVFDAPDIEARCREFLALIEN
jgi:ribulose-phosphate 3-epimerase